ncbi:hypothetical protein KAH81_07100 [bacterium]|nr:hypothetical protein [bacterium]
MCGDEAFEEFNQALEVAISYYVNAKDLLLSIIWELEKPDDFAYEYGFKDETPTRLKRT